ncbi:MAG: alkaline phosphatase [Muribaculaceae bacterium]
MIKRFLTLMCCVAIALAMAAKQPKFIFYFIGDGMGLSPVLCTETYNRTVCQNANPLLMLQFPVVSYATSYSASSTITDSAAAGTALSTGHKTNNSSLGVDTQNQPVTSVAKELHDLGYGVAIATSVDPDDATPGAFYAHVPKRYMFYEIAQDMARSGYDMFAGARLRGKAPEGGKDVKTLLAEAGYTVVNGPEGYKANKDKRRLVLLNTTEELDHIGYAIDSVSTNLTLPFITQACLEHQLKVSPKQFFIMVEGGLIDHSLHANDAATSVKETINFNQAIQVAYDFYLQHPDETLIVVTADHNTGGMAAAVNGGPSTHAMRNFDYQRVSIEQMQADCRKMLDGDNQPTWEDMKQYLTSKFGLYGAIEVNQKLDDELQEAFNNTFVARNTADKKTLYASFNQFVGKTFNVLDRLTGIGWTTYGHSGDFVPVFAIGVGSEVFQGFQDNIDIPNKIRSLCGIPQHSSK